MMPRFNMEGPVRRSPRRKRSLLVCVGGALAVAILMKVSVDVLTMHRLIVSSTGSLIYEDTMAIPRNIGIVKANTQVSDEGTAERRYMDASLELSTNYTLAAKAPFAYAYVIGGCNPNKPGYRGFLYNILVSARLFHRVGSTADIVAFFQLTNDSPATELAAEDIRLLLSVGVRILYLPKSPLESFYETVMLKFRVLSLTEYQRVILMDGDVMPLENLDYLFHMSVAGILKPNLVVAGTKEPANAGFFMLEPGIGEYEHILSIIEKREKNARTANVPFDVNQGWGHAIEAPDEWSSRREHGTKWDFHFAFSDQGLLYHWTKYVKKNVSIVFQYHVENWSSYPNGTNSLEEKMDQPFRNFSNESTLLVYAFGPCKKFMCGFKHFTGSIKPWLEGPPPPGTTSEERGVTSLLWWETLRELNVDLEMVLDFENFEIATPEQGLFTTMGDMNLHAQNQAVAEE